MILNKQMLLSLFFSLFLFNSIAVAGNEYKSEGVDFVFVPAGCFEMGDNFGDGYFNEYPVHEVCLKGFQITRYAVTVDDFKKFTEDASYRTDAEASDGCYIYNGKSWSRDSAANWRKTGFRQDNDHPVVCVSWYDAVAYGKWFSGKSKKDCRLPSEAEWEYAARSGGKQEKYAGSNNVNIVAWYAFNSEGRTHRVGQKQPNGLGLYDMSGNVWQWTADWYSENYYRISSGNDPKGPSAGTNRVYRGGSWFYDEKGVRTSYRDFFLPGFRSSQLGFRLVCNDERTK